MKVFVIGATGMAGSAFVKEAAKNNLEIIANGRSTDKLAKLKAEVPSIQTVAQDAFTLTKDDFGDCDVIVDAFSTAPAQAYRHTDLAAHLIRLFRETTSPRLAFILGAGSLITGADHHRVLQDIEQDESTKPWRNTPKNQYFEYQFLQNVDNVNWFGISPANLFVPGEKAAKILTGKDELLYNEQGESVTTAGTMATALVQEILTPKHHQERFTVANG
ncbi:NAD(P)H-binding protein [Lactobacillus sp. ESL0731]|uniref:NAD(P)-dependent oxidoreductase n=1 Tax=unclassified Lactobacillus TaxID=2620435 RepID=UPI0023F7014F|nr:MULTISPECIES: NAD(P)H-binding protein [unclassified Lactobacillus]WEV51838.1 NAD(P)H-binding protein [Lactobacillus sp. ESL0700]WEV62968.1 NAD(P)H-binding protein [Lactobacillus sp. ESL0731]